MNNYGCAYVWGKMCDAYIIAFLDLWSVYLWSVYLCYAFYLWYLYLWSYYLWAVYLCVVPLLVKPLLALPWLVIPLLAMPLLVKLLLVKRLLVWYLYLCETFSCVMFLLVTCLLWSFYSFAHVNFTLDTLSSNLSLEVWLHLDTCVRKSIYSQKKHIHHWYSAVSVAPQVLAFVCVWPLWHSNGDQNGGSGAAAAAGLHAKRGLSSEEKWRLKFEIRNTFVVVKCVDVKFNNGFTCKKRFLQKQSLVLLSYVWWKMIFYRRTLWGS